MPIEIIVLLGGVTLFFLIKEFKTIEHFQPRLPVRRQDDAHVNNLVKKISVIKDFITNDDIRRKFKQKVVDNSVTFISCDTGSFTINKKEVNICINDKRTAKRYSNNVLIYVILHEIAHVLCESEHHTDEWETIFNHLINAAMRCNLYDDSKQFPKNYCKL
jgi:predicted metal-dependent hydrolase